MSEQETGQLRITLVRSTIGRPSVQGRTVQALVCARSTPLLCVRTIPSIAAWSTASATW
jgi:hypothetical protein